MALLTSSVLLWLLSDTMNLFSEVLFSFGESLQHVNCLHLCKPFQMELIVCNILLTSYIVCVPSCQLRSSSDGRISFQGSCT